MVKLWLYTDQVQDPGAGERDQQAAQEHDQHADDEQVPTFQATFAKNHRVRGCADDEGNAHRGSQGDQNGRRRRNMERVG